MTDYTRLCQTGDVSDDEPFGAMVGDHAIAVYMIDGAYFATDNRCTHGNALLSDGYQDGDKIECPFHGGAFDIRTGAAVTFPCQIPIRTYDVRIEDGWLEIPTGALGVADQ